MTNNRKTSAKGTLISKRFLGCASLILLCLLALTVAIILYIKRNSGVFGVILVLLTASALLASVFASVIIYKKRYKYCRFCGKSLERGRCYYSLGEIKANEVRAVQTVRFKSKCRGCGHKNIFERKFTIIHTSLDGRWKSYDIDERAIDFIEKSFR